MSTVRNTTVLACLLLLVTTSACNRRADSGLETALSASGYIEATEVRLSTKIGGTLDWFPIAEGDRLDEGAEVARIATTDLRLQLDAARAEQELALAELQLKSSGFRPEEVNEARAGVERARTELAAAERDLERFAGLLESGSGTEKARDDARSRRDVARAALEAAEQRLRKLEAGFRKEEIAAARARSNAAAARIALLEQQINDATVTSPVRGTITEKLVEQGELLPAGALLAVLSDLENVWLTAYVGEPDLDRIQLGQAVQLVTDSGEIRFGTLSWISPQAEFTPKNVQTRDERIKLVFKIKVLVEDNDGLFKPGMPGTAMLETSTS